MANVKGTDFLLTEADCSDGSEDAGDNETSQSDVSDLIDNSVCDQGNSRELFAKQQAAEFSSHIESVKRKLPLTSRKVLQEISSQCNTTPARHRPAKRRNLDDSGYAEDNAAEVVEVENSHFDHGSEGYGSLPTSQRQKGRDKENRDYKELLQTSNEKAGKLAKFKKAFDVSFTSLTRTFQSNKTCCSNWVAAVFGARDDVLEASKTLFQQHCDYFYLNCKTCSLGCLGLYLFQFKSGKSRDTVKKLVCSLLDVEDIQLLLEPPKIKSVPAAVFWWKSGLSANAFSWGPMPDWVAAQTLITHTQAQETPFDLSVMVQWAYDHDLTDESKIAYYYARLATEEPNAAAFLRCNNQVKHVKECAQMTRYYKQAEMREMNMSQWIWKSIELIEDGGDWRNIVKFIRYQNINFVSFLTAFKDFLHGLPKRNCLTIYGAPNTGKSQFAMSLLKTLRGSVISYVNYKSHFWLQPLQNAKLAVLDDATGPTWTYFDTFLRNGLDGNPVSLDCKHRAPVQVSFPPLLITTNINVPSDEKYTYLHSRITFFEFPNPFPFNDDGSAVFALNELSWKSFFTRLWKTLGLTYPEEEDGEPPSPFRCCARKADGDL
ncbi:E1 protein [Cervus elaphus papillomavirus 2]|uniref:Replication protein E1 n=2 Tax=Firstpapillomavirinae TaxID=2169595 RepID=A0A1I9KHZ0_9PAPI|nr:E1 protein [Cervus elaphus papillomavirus 2]ALP46947.1 E1 protein [Cervus elaphus papillomavirus 2]